MGQLLRYHRIYKCNVCVMTKGLLSGVAAGLEQTGSKRRQMKVKRLTLYQTEKPEEERNIWNMYVLRVKLRYCVTTKSMESLLTVWQPGQ